MCYLFSLSLGTDVMHQQGSLPKPPLDGRPTNMLQQNSCHVICMDICGRSLAFHGRPKGGRDSLWELPVMAGRQHAATEFLSCNLYRSSPSISRLPWQAQRGNHPPLPVMAGRLTCCNRILAVQSVFLSGLSLGTHLRR